MGVLRYSSLCLLLLMLIAPSVLGAGFAFDGLGVKARGMGGAFRAIADDWSAAYYNPAGYYRIADNQIAYNLTVMHNRYTAVPNVTFGDYDNTGFYNGQEVYNEHEILNVPQGGILFRLPVWGETVFGFTIMQTFDQNHNWNLYSNLAAYNTAAHPQHQFYNNLDVVAFQATAAKGFMEDRLSVGIGLSLLRGDLWFSNVVLRDNPLGAPLDSRPYDKIPEWYNNDGKGWGFGYKVGFLYEVNEKLDVALVYNGAASITISGETDFKFYLGDNPTGAEDYFETTEEHYFLEGNTQEVLSDFETTLDVPASIGFGAAYDLNEKLTLALDAEYTFWSSFEGFDFEYSNFSGLTNSDFTRLNTLFTTDMSIPIEWDDGGCVMVGANYKFRDFVDFRGGFGVDQTIVKTDTFIPHFIDLTTKYSYSLGVGFKVDFWYLDLATTYTHQKDLAVPNVVDFNDDGLMDNIAGDYKADNYQTVLGISYRF